MSIRELETVVVTYTERSLWRDSDDLESIGDGDSTESFSRFFEFAFPRVYRYAQQRTGNDAQAQTLCRLVLTRAVTSIGSIDLIDRRFQQDPEELAYWLFILARRTADRFCNELADGPTPLMESAIAAELEDQTLELLRNTR